MARFIRGLFTAAAGFALIYYAADLVGMFGRNAWMERNLSGTRAGYMLFGFGIMLIGFMMMFGLIDLGGGVEEATQIQIGT